MANEREVAPADGEVRRAKSGAGRGLGVLAGVELEDPARVQGVDKVGVDGLRDAKEGGGIEAAAVGLKVRQWGGADMRGGL